MVDIDPLTELTIKLSRQALSETDKHFAICNCIRKVIPTADRVSLWRFENDRSSIRCLLLIQPPSQANITGVVLHSRECPEYFEGILKDQVLAASDARNHPHTSCFNEPYFIPNDIYSMLDFIFHHDFKPIGVISCEAVGQMITWSEQDIALLKRVASVTSMFYDS